MKQKEMKISRISAIRIPDNDNKLTTTKHFEALGNVWQSLFPSNNDLIKNVKASVARAEFIFHNEKHIIYLDSQCDDTGIVHIIEMGKKKNKYVSSAPFFKGFNNDLIMKDIYSWKRPSEGEISATFSEDISLSFYDPLFIIDKDKYKSGNTETINLSAVAFKIKKLKEEEFVVSEGKTYDYYLKEFLKENPNKKEKDFEAPVFKLNAESFRMFSETDYSSEYEVSGQIVDIKYTSLFDHKLTVLKVNFSHNDEKEKLYINIYVSDKVLGKYRPQIGEGITSILWVNGWFN